MVLYEKHSSKDGTGSKQIIIDNLAYKVRDICYVCGKKKYFN